MQKSPILPVGLSAVETLSLATSPVNLRWEISPLPSTNSNWAPTRCCKTAPDTLVPEEFACRLAACSSRSPTIEPTLRDRLRSSLKGLPAKNRCNRPRAARTIPGPATNSRKSSNLVLRNSNWSRTTTRRQSEQRRPGSLLCRFFKLDHWRIDAVVRVAYIILWHLPHFWRHIWVGAQDTYCYPNGGSRAR